MRESVPQLTGGNHIYRVGAIQISSPNNSSPLCSIAPTIQLNNLHPIWSKTVEQIFVFSFFHRDRCRKCFFMICYVSCYVLNLSCWFVTHLNTYHIYFLRESYVQFRFLNFQFDHIWKILNTCVDSYGENNKNKHGCGCVRVR